MCFASKASKPFAGARIYRARRAQNSSKDINIVHVLQVQSSPCPMGTDWCSDPVGYPHRFVRQVMNNSHPLWPAIRDHSHAVQLHKRASHSHMRMFSSSPACELVETFLVPRAAKNKNREWRFIVNSQQDQEPEYQQVKHLYMASLKDSKCYILSTVMYPRCILYLL